MKTIIWIIVVLLVVWGLWAWLGRTNSATNTANTAGAGYDNGGSVTASSTNVQENLDTSVGGKG